MKLFEFYKIANDFAPKSLSDEYCTRYGAYDNSGILVDTGDDVKSVLFSLDLSFLAIEKAIQAGANVIVTHHPAIYAKIAEINASDFQPLGEKLVKCIKNGISVISMHLNLDCAKGGIDESLQQAVVGDESAKNLAIMHPLSGDCGYGRAYDIAPSTLQSVMNNVKERLRAEKITVYGDKDKTITRIASFCGGGADESAVEFAVAQGAQVILSSDFKHHVLTLAVEKGLAVIVPTHYASENFGFEKYYKKICQSIDLPCIFHTESSML